MNDVILYQVTSRENRDRDCVDLNASDLSYCGAAALFKQR